MQENGKKDKIWKGKGKTGKKKAFCKQRIAETSCMRKKTVGILKHLDNILITSRDVDIKIMQSIKITARPSTRIRKRKQNNTYI